MEGHVDAILLLSNVMFALRRERPHSFRRLAEPSRQQLQAKAVEEAIGVAIGNSPCEEPHHPLADQSLAPV